MSVTAASLSTRPQRYTVVVPHRLAEPRPTAQVYVRRRLLVGLVLVAFVVAGWFGAGSVRATRGGAPAAAAAVRPAVTYVVQPGDSLWSIAEAHHGDISLTAYVDMLVGRNGGATIQVGQALLLP